MTRESEEEDVFDRAVGRRGGRIVMDRNYPYVHSRCLDLKRPHYARRSRQRSEKRVAMNYYSARKGLTALYNRELINGAPGH